MCNCVQPKSEYATTIGPDRRLNEKADPGFPRSASIDCKLLMPQELVAARSWRFKSSLPQNP
jgi:hypothetical protein